MGMIYAVHVTLAEFLLDRIRDDERFAHANRHTLGQADPAGYRRMLAEIDSARKLVRLHTGEHDCVGGGDPCLTLRLLAAPRAAEHGYRDEWKPGHDEKAPTRT